MNQNICSIVTFVDVFVQVLDSCLWCELLLLIHRI